MDPIIKEVTIQPVTSPLGDMGVTVVLEEQTDGSLSEGYLFSWFNDEIQFNESELIGLTVLEAHRLRHAKHDAASGKVWGRDRMSYHHPDRLKQHHEAS